MLVVGLEGPAELGPHVDDESAVLYVARRLAAEGISDWYPLRRVSTEALAVWTGPAAPPVRSALVDVSGGRAAWAAQLWRDWIARGAISEDLSGRWCFAARDRALDPVYDLLASKLMTASQNDLRRVEEAREILCYAALEGRHFTADAIAYATKRDSDEVVDLLDDLFAADDDPEALLRFDGWVRVEDEAGERRFSLYYFTQELQWLTLRHSLGERQKRAYCQNLARALDALYGGGASAVAHALARLYSVGGEPRPVPCTSGAWPTSEPAGR